MSGLGFRQSPADFGKVTAEYFSLGAGLSLGRGDKGQEVFDLQLAIEKHFDEKGITAFPKFGADGDYGSETEEWVRKYQSDVGLSASGVADSQTLEKLGLVEGNKIVSPSASGPKKPMPKGPIIAGIAALGLIGVLFVMKKKGKTPKLAANPLKRRKRRRKTRMK